MTEPADLPAILIAAEADKAAGDNGFRDKKPAQGPWHVFGSLTASGTLWLSAPSPAGPWTIAIDHAGVVAELGVEPVKVPGPGLARYIFPTLGAAYPVLERIYRLARSLPSFPLTEFEKVAAALPRTTDAERLVVQRIGQDVFRAALMNYWHGRCPLTGIADTALLRASHIVAWAECATDAERLDVHNGLLLSGLWDLAFDAGLVSFDDDGQVLVKPALSYEARLSLDVEHALRLTFNDHHRGYLKRHREQYGFSMS